MEYCTVLETPKKNGPDGKGCVPKRTPQQKDKKNSGVHPRVSTLIQPSFQKKKKKKKRAKRKNIKSFIKTHSNLPFFFLNLFSDVTHANPTPMDCMDCMVLHGWIHPVIVPRRCSMIPPDLLPTPEVT